jgi:hypothetical protein
VAQSFARLLRRYPAVVVVLLTVVSLVAARLGHPHGMWDGPI